MLVLAYRNLSQYRVRNQKRVKPELLSADETPLNVRFVCDVRICFSKEWFWLSKC